MKDSREEVFSVEIALCTNLSFFAVRDFSLFCRGCDKSPPGTSLAEFRQNVLPATGSDQLMFLDKANPCHISVSLLSLVS